MRTIVGAALGVILAGGAVGLAIDLHDAQARTHSDLQRSATERASLAGGLIDSMFQNSYRTSHARLFPISRPRVTVSNVRSVTDPGRLGVVLNQGGRVLASWPPLSSANAGLVESDPSVQAALAGRRDGLSNLLSLGGKLQEGYIAASSYQTPFGRRVRISWFPEAAMRSMLSGYLRDVAHYPGAQVYLVDGADRVIGSSSGTPDQGPSTVRDNREFVAVSTLHVAPWHVRYSVPFKVLYASSGNDESLSYVLLAALVIAALGCVFLLFRLSSRSSALGKANVDLAARSAEAELANNAKSQFLATMSHELRTPLNAIIGFADLMHDERLGPVSDQHREALDDIRGSSRHLLDLINEVLDLARIESGRILLDVHAVDAVQVVSSGVDSLRPLASERNLVVTLEAQSFGAVELDPARLRQVLLNYLSNAIKFTPEGGLVQVRVVREEHELLLEVTDTGGGIAEADQERVFGEFEQLHGAAYGGTGLGLAVTKRIVEAQGGTVGVHSTPGHGSTFYARLPVASAPAPIEQPALQPGLLGLASPVAVQ